jgi:hypothetical protein
MSEVDEAAVLRTFMRDGRITGLPAKRSRRLVLLDHIAQMFEVGVRYPEGQVNLMLRNVHEDYAALRRYLVDEGFLSRERGEYWRSGGTVDVQ